MDNFNVTEHSTIEDFKTYNDIRNRIIDLEKTLHERIDKMQIRIEVLEKMTESTTGDTMEVLKERISKWHKFTEKP